MTARIPPVPTSAPCQCAIKRRRADAPQALGGVPLAFGAQVEAAATLAAADAFLAGATCRLYCCGAADASSGPLKPSQNGERRALCRQSVVVPSVVVPHVGTYAAVGKPVDVTHGTDRMDVSYKQLAMHGTEALSSALARHRRVRTGSKRSWAAVYDTEELSSSPAAGGYLGLLAAAAAAAKPHVLHHHAHANDGPSYGHGSDPRVRRGSAVMTEGSGQGRPRSWPAGLQPTAAPLHCSPDQLPACADVRYSRLLPLSCAHIAFMPQPRHPYTHSYYDSAAGLPAAAAALLEPPVGPPVAQQRTAPAAAAAPSGHHPHHSTNRGVLAGPMHLQQQQPGSWGPDPRQASTPPASQPPPLARTHHNTPGAATIALSGATAASRAPAPVLLPTPARTISSGWVPPPPGAPAVDPTAVPGWGLPPNLTAAVSPSGPPPSPVTSGLQWTAASASRPAATVTTGCGSARSAVAAGLTTPAATSSRPTVGGPIAPQQLRQGPPAQGPSASASSAQAVPPPAAVKQEPQEPVVNGTELVRQVLLRLWPLAQKSAQRAAEVGVASGVPMGSAMPICSVSGAWTGPSQPHHHTHHHQHHRHQQHHHGSHQHYHAASHRQTQTQPGSSKATSPPALPTNLEAPGGSQSQPQPHAGSEPRQTKRSQQPQPHVETEIEASSAHAGIVKVDSVQGVAVGRQMPDDSELPAQPEAKSSRTTEPDSTSWQQQHHEAAPREAPVLPGLERLLEAAAAAAAAAAALGAPGGLSPCPSPPGAVTLSDQTPGPAAGQSSSSSPPPEAPAPRATRMEDFFEPDGTLLQGAVLQTACNIIRLAKGRAGLHIALPWCDAPDATSSSFPKKAAGGATAPSWLAVLDRQGGLPLAAALQLLVAFAGAARALQAAQARTASGSSQSVSGGSTGFAALHPLMRRGLKYAEKLMVKVERALTGEAAPEDSSPCPSPVISR